MARRRRIAIIIDTHGSYGRKVISGIVRYMEHHDRWDVYLETGTAENPAGIKHWSGDGILARVRSPEMRAALDEIDVPKVVLNPKPRSPHLTAPEGVAAVPDRVADSELAVGHFLERGFRRVAFCCQTGGQGHGRFDTTQVAAEEAGLEFFANQCQQQPSWHEQQEQLINWLRALPKPIGIIAANDICGREVIDAAKLVNIRIPDEIAVLGSDNDELVCTMCTPRLSSIRIASDEIGFRSAQLLDRLLDGEPPPAQPVQVLPLGVVTRQSTDVLAIADAEVVDALRVIRDGAVKGITVQQVLDQVPISRRSLERRFQKWIGRNPQEEIRAVQIKEVQRLLTDTRLKLDQVAVRAGFVSAARLAQAFRAATGTTPSAYRRAAARDSIR